MDWTGETVGDRYVIEEKLDAGGMGTVYLARDTGVRGRRVVVKVPHPKLLTPDFRRRFEIEIDQLVALEHPNVVHVYGAGTHDGVPYLAVQYLAGGDLTARIRQGRLTPEEVVPWLRGIASALDHAHRNGCIHRDVKPGNIIFDGEGHAYLSDFGIAMVVSSTESNDEGLTRAGTFLGSIPYLPPEAMTREFGPPYDQYSLALVVYHALSGKMAFEGDTTRAILEAKVAGDAVSLDLRVAGLAPGVVAAVMRAISVAPGERFASCSDFADAFEAGVRGELPASAPAAAPAPARPAGRARPAAVRSAPKAMPSTGSLQLYGLIAAAVVLAGVLVWLVLTPPEDAAVETALDPSLPVAPPDPVPSREPAPGEGAPVAEASVEPLAPPGDPPPALEPLAPPGDGSAGLEPVEPPAGPGVAAARAFFARRDVSRFEADRLDSPVIGLVRAGDRIDGVEVGSGWVRVASEAGSGSGFVRLAALGDAPPVSLPAPTRRVVLVPEAPGEPAFRIDTREVGVRGYLTCVAAGGCSAPATGTGCRDRSAGDAPVNCVTVEQAAGFCGWAGKRLASESEWLRGAAVPEAVGFAGGIAEWTATREGDAAVVRESPDARFAAPAGAAYPDVGFRCAAG